MKPMRVCGSASALTKLVFTELFENGMGRKGCTSASSSCNGWRRVYLYCRWTLCGLIKRIAELKRAECRAGVEDVMYMLIYYKFSEIGVYLVPRISQCVFNGRLEIWPSRDWELEFILSIEALEMVREHLNDVVGWRTNSNVTESWAITEIERLHLCKLYAASVLFGYVLKTASLRQFGIGSIP